MNQSSNPFFFNSGPKIYPKPKQNKPKGKNSDFEKSAVRVGHKEEENLIEPKTLNPNPKSVVLILNPKIDVDGKLDSYQKRITIPIRSKESLKRTDKEKYFGEGVNPFYQHTDELNELFDSIKHHHHLLQISGFDGWVSQRKIDELKEDIQSVLYGNEVDIDSLNQTLFEKLSIIIKPQ